MNDLDEVDDKIIKILRANARASLSSIAKELGISKTAVKKRIDRLVREGIISKFTIELSARAEVKALIFIKTTAKVRTAETADIISKLPYVDKVYEVAGDYDLVALVSAPTVEVLNDAVDKIREIQTVTSTVTVMVLKSY
ncbi:MAG: AsnC family transcriptional regulator [Fervidicoccaceae archaeon]